ncbi:MAG: VWA domain-containing protein [Candidatus Heimdallarchaeaceae archaeon]
MKRKEILIAVFVLGLFFISSTTGFGEQNREPSTYFVPSQVNNPLDNVTIELVTDVPSRRDDNIPSVLPGSSFAFSFNITNYSGEQLRDTEIFPRTNDYGLVTNNHTSSRSLLNSGESWISSEYIVDVVDDSSGISSGLDLAILLDQSGSMGDEIETLTSELIDVVDSIDEQVPDLRIGLILFGGSSHNPYLYDNLVTPLTHNIEDIVEVLDSTGANGGNEPWGDALWVAQHRLDWREDAVKLIILITDEKGDEGEIVSFISETTDDVLNIYDLYEQLAADNFITCTVAASGSDSSTITRLASAAETTEGTFIQLGGDGPQTGDLPEIVGELIVKYSVELDLKISAVFSYLNDDDAREYKKEIFVVLIDELPPEVDSWIYFSEEYTSDKKFVNIMSEVKDVTGVSFVEAYYRFDNVPYWNTVNSSQVFNDTYLLSIEFSDEQEVLFYLFYCEDWLGNSNLTEVSMIELTKANEYTSLAVSKKMELLLIPNHSIICSLVDNSAQDSFGIVFSEHDAEFNIRVSDFENSQILLDLTNQTMLSFPISRGEDIKLTLTAFELVSVQIAHVVPENLEFENVINRHISETDAFLFAVDNEYDDNYSRCIIADSQIVQTGIYVFNASNWEFLLKNSSEVLLPKGQCYVLVISVYHTGEIMITFNYDSLYDPYDHYYAPEATSWPWIFVVLSLGAMVCTYECRRRRKSRCL